MRYVLVLVALAVGPLSCGDEPTVSPAPDARAPLVIYGHGGGIATMPRILQVDRDGRATLTVTVAGRNGPRNELSEFDLPDAELRELERQLKAAAEDSAPSEPTRCADCFTYSIDADGIDAELDQISIAEASPEVRELVATLERLSAP